MKNECGYWIVNWDSGSAAGSFPYHFATEAEAEAYGNDWAEESNLRDGIGDEWDGYSAEPYFVECQGCEKCCPEDGSCKGCAYCYEDPCDYKGMGWVGKNGRP